MIVAARRSVPVLVVAGKLVFLILIVAQISSSLSRHIGVSRNTVRRYLRDSNAARRQPRAARPAGAATSAAANAVLRTRFMWRIG